MLQCASFPLQLQYGFCFCFLTELRADQPSVRLQLDLDTYQYQPPDSYNQNDQQDKEAATASAADFNSFDNPSETETEKCPVGFIRFKNSCYHVVEATGEMTWHVASTYCQLKESRLVEIQSELEQQFVESLVSKSPRTSAYWLGGTNRKGRGLWEWEGSSQAMKYTLWVSQWSSWAYEVDSGSCTVLDTGESNQWMFWPCQNNFYMGGDRHEMKTGIGIICEKRSPRSNKKIRHRKHKRRRRQKRKGRRSRWLRKLIAQSALLNAL